MTVKEKNLSNWEEFEAEVSHHRENLENKRKGRSSSLPKLLFRGQSNSSWTLQTTLERYTYVTYDLVRYYQHVLLARPVIESRLGRAWEIPSRSDFIDTISNNSHPILNSIPGYAFFAYLRHYGFPSPLLDWTRSLYIAAFFAFRNASPERAENVSIYMYLEYPGGGKAYDMGEPVISTFGPNVRTHQRHFDQQSEYSICTRFIDDRYEFFCHQDYHDANRSNQDLIWKYNIPINERERVLANLDQHNLSAYTLFGSEDSLMETLALRQIVLNSNS